MTPIERAARALCSLDGLPENTKFEGKPMWMSFIGEATAVVRSMREPSNEIRMKAWFKFPTGENRPNDLDVWQAMIDATLAESA